MLRQARPEGAESAWAHYCIVAPDREAIARYGLRLMDVMNVVETAIGGLDIDTSIDLLREALDIVPVGHRYRLGLLANLADALAARFEAAPWWADRQAALTSVTNALDECPAGRPERAQLLHVRARLLLRGASAGPGSAQHLAGELFNLLAKTQLQHVAYKGGGPAMIDVMSGQVPVMFASMGSAWQHVKNGKLRAVAVGGAQRSKAAPDLPTIAESGVPGYETYEWNAVFAPAGTPPEIVTRLNTELNKALRSPDIQERLFQIGAEPAPGTPKELDDYVRKELAKWAKVVKEVGIKVE